MKRALTWVCCAWLLSACADVHAVSLGSFSAGSSGAHAQDAGAADDEGNEREHDASMAPKGEDEHSDDEESSDDSNSGKDEHTDGSGTPES